ncbi:MAG: GNAT family N-acyltransferase [Cellvibrionaceae bacterium]
MFTVDKLLAEHHPQLYNKPWISKPTCLFLRYILKEREINTFIEQYPHLEGLDFVEQILEHFDFSFSVSGNEKEYIPPLGRLIIAANHPIGSLDGLTLIKLVSEVRKDIRVLTNDKLIPIKPLHSILISNEHLNNKDKQYQNTTKTCKSTIDQHLQNEGALIIFPAGEVSRLKPHGIRDCRWKTHFLQIALSAKSPILPIYIDGKNSSLFYTASMLYKPLATLLLISEMFKHRTKRLPIRIGELIAFDSYSTSNIPLPQIAKLFKKHIYRLGEGKATIFKTQKPIAPAENRQALSQAIKQCEQLGETGDGKEILLYRYTSSSPLMREIGRLREIAFRAVGEGSNKRRDIDQYDANYFHLVLWDSNDLEVVGAYRLGDAKQLAKQRNNQLYSATLFNYTDKMTPYFEQGLELGRSFIQPKYWGKRSLDYLWYGIGAFLRHHPQYRYLFGPVSLSNSLPDSAKDLIVCFYQLYFGDKRELATPKRTYQASSATTNFFSGNDYKNDFIKLKSLLNNMDAAIPTLYKQYTETYQDDGVHFLGFSVDPEFNYCVDGLVLADLNMLKEKKKKRYMSD